MESDSDNSDNEGDQLSELLATFEPTQYGIDESDDVMDGVDPANSSSDTSDEELCSEVSEEAGADEDMCNHSEDSDTNRSEVSTSLHGGSSFNEDAEGKEVDDENSDSDNNDENNDSDENDDDGSDGDSSEDGDKEEETEETTNYKDPFSNHFCQNITEDVACQIKSKTWRSCFKRWKHLGRIKFVTPDVVLQKKTALLLEDLKEKPLPTIGKLVDDQCTSQQLLKFVSLQLSKRLSFSEKDSGNSSWELSPWQRELFRIMSNYHDVYFPEAKTEMLDRVCEVYCLHIVNHMLKTRRRIVEHNHRINKIQHLDEADEYRDQGFVRPKVLVVVPFKHSAYRVVKTLISLMFPGDPKGSVWHLNRFEDDFGSSNYERKSRVSCPDDFYEIFKGNIKEDFKIGMTITKKCLKLYTSFYQSDIIIASPLGLRYTVGSTTNSDSSSDFLASIEVLVLDQADVFCMQNWEHLLIIQEALNLIPKDLQSLNLSRVRHWSLNGFAPYYRQTLLFASTVVDYNRAFISKSLNFAGAVQVLNSSIHGAVDEVGVSAEMILRKVPGTLNADSRFTYFTEKVLPEFRSKLLKHTLIYIPDYCDYIRVYKYFKEDKRTAITSINEYITDVTKIAKARGLFFSGKRQFLLFTERFHFYHRYRIKGIRHLIFYDLPTYPHFFSEMCNMMAEANQNLKREHLGLSTVTVLYQKSDITKLVGILGSKRVAKLDANKMFHSCTIGR